MTVALIDAMARNPSLKDIFAGIMYQSIDTMVSNYKKCGCLPASYVSDLVIFPPDPTTTTLSPDAMTS